MGLLISRLCLSAYDHSISIGSNTEIDNLKEKSTTKISLEKSEFPDADLIPSIATEILTQLEERADHSSIPDAAPCFLSTTNMRKVRELNETTQLTAARILCDSEIPDAAPIPSYFPNHWKLLNLNCALNMIKDFRVYQQAGFGLSADPELQKRFTISFDEANSAILTLPYEIAKRILSTIATLKRIEILEEEIRKLAIL